MVGHGRLIGRNLLRLWMALVITALLLPLVPSQPNRPVGQPDVVEAQGVNDPQLLVSSGVTSFSVFLARVLWLSLPGCPPPGPVDPRGAPQPPAALGAPVQTGEGSLPAVAESVAPAEPAVDEPGRITPAQAGAPVVIRRTDTRGLFGFRVLFERNDPRAAGVCNPYQVRSNLISDGTHVYWVDASGLVRLSLEASPDQAPERVTAEVGGPKAGGQVTNVQLVMTDDSVYAITTETTRARLDRVLKANGRTSTEALIRGTPVALKTNGVFIHWIEARTLYRHRIGETGVVGAIANDVTNYAPGPGQYLYFGRNQQIWVYDYGLALVGQGPLYTGALPTHRVIDIVQDRNNLYFFEAQCSNPQGCLAPERFLLFRRGKAANARTEVLANLSARAVPPRNLHVTLEFLLWQDNDRIVRLPKDVAAVPQTNLRATRMLVTQGIQQRDNSIRLIQDRRTFVRVFAQADGPPVAGITATLFATFNNGRSNEALTRPINPAGPAITVPSAENRDDINASFLFELPWNWTRQSDLVLRAVINSNNWPLEPSRADNLITLGPIRFEPSPRLQVRFIRYAYPLMGELPVASLADYDNALSWIRRSFPLASRPAAYNSRERGLATTEFFRADVDLGEQVQYPLPCPMDAAGNANCDNLRASGYVNSQIEAERAEFGDEAGTRYYSMIPRHTMFFPRGQAATVASSGPVPDAGDYAAHEIAHTLGRPHPTPGSMACGHSASDNNYPYANAAIGDAQDEGFDPGNPVFGGTPSIRPSSGWFDIMGYCSPLWISDYTYNALFDSIANNDALNVGAAATMRVAGDWLMAYGVITPSANQATFHRLRRVPEVAQVPNRVPGDYSLQLLDAQNAVVADYPFTPKTLEDADPPMLQFGEVVSFVPGATQVRIIRLADQRVVATRPVSTNPPTVGSVRLDPSPAGPVSGTVTLRWDAADPDGDALKFDVLYSRDGGTRFDPLQLNLTTREAQVDTARLGGGNAIFRVVATDGVNSARADTPPFMMANKPPVPKILSPADGSRFRFEQNINLLGTAEDFQDGTVPDAMLVWSSQRGRIGTGSMISSTLFPPGPNEITLTATNRDGLSASTKIMIVVSDDVELPNPTLSAGPTDINWHVAAGTTQLQTAMVQVANPGTGALSYTATSDQPWLTVTPASGTAPGQLTLAANPAGLPSSSVNTATVQLRAPGVEGAPEQMVNVRVRLTIGDVFSTPPGTSPSTAPPAPTPPAGGMMVYIPTARNAVADPTFGGTWRTGLQVFNRDLSKPAVVQIRYYRPDGTQAAVTTPKMIAVSRSETFFGSTIGVSESFNGSAIVIADAPISVISNQLAQDTGLSGSFNGITETRQKVHVPIALRSAVEANTSLYIQNAGTRATGRVEVRFYRLDEATPVATRTLDAPIAPGASFELRQDQLTELGDTFQGSAVVEADQPLAVVVNQSNRRSLLASVGQPSGAATLYGPLVMHNNGGFSSAVQVQNTGSAPTSVTVRVVSTFTGQQVVETTRTIQPGVATNWSLRTLLGNDNRFVGSITITAGSGGSLIGVVNQINPDTNQATAYALFTQGASTVIAPLVQTSNSGWNSGFQVQNVGATTATVTVAVTDTGGAVVGSVPTPTRTIAPGRSETWFPITAIGTRVVGSAIATTTDSTARLVGVVNQLNQESGNVDFFTTYEALNP